VRAVEYLGRVEPVCRSMFDALHAAEHQAENERRYLEPQFEYLRFQFEHWSQIEEYDDQRLNYAHSRAGEAHQALLLIDTAAAAAAGSILQIAKLCISMAWPSTDRFSKGRMVGSQHLSRVIWQARNQALHFEEGMPRDRRTRECIEALSVEVGLDIRQLAETPRSLAKDVVGLLGWHSYEGFARDMCAMLDEA